jgi:MFS family permease
VSGILILLFVEEPQRAPTLSPTGHFRWKDLAALRHNHTLLWLIPSVALSTSLVLVSFLVTYLVDVRGLTNAQGTWALAATAVGFVFSSLLGGWLGDWFERHWPRRGRVWLMQLFLLAYAGTSALALQVAWPELWMTYASFGLLGLVSAIGYSGCVLPMIAKVTPPEVRTSVFGFLLSFVQGGVTAGLSLLVGFWAASAGLPTVMFWVGTFPYLVNAVLWLVFWKAYPRDSSSMRE